MHVVSDSISMSSDRRYSKRTSYTVEKSNSFDKVLSPMFSRTTKQEHAHGMPEDVHQYSGKKRNEEFPSETPAAGVTGVSGRAGRDPERELFRMKIECVNYLMTILFGNKARRLPGMYGGGYGMFSGGSGAGFGNREGYALAETFVSAETEETQFNTQGHVVTADGKVVDFNLNLTMSRSFYEESIAYKDFEMPELTDPLVINLDCGACEVTDQKFYFDLDADGHEEYISRLGPGSGYLALDKNGNGKVDSGNELFGALTGDGFSELAQYDTDGNGWIDEADEIFDKLLIWSTDASGKEKLVALGKAGVGAIFTGNTQTDFSMNDAYNRTNAVIRKTGVFLYENGNVGTMQQIDVAG